MKTECIKTDKLELWAVKNGKFRKAGKMTQAEYWIALQNYNDRTQHRNAAHFFLQRSDGRTLNY